MQLGPGTASLACASLIVPFAPFTGATGSLIDRDFVRSKEMNTQTLSHNIPVFNVDGSPNEAGQISEVVDVVLCYKTHSERMLLAISELGKQSLILGYNWLKDHNPKID